MPGPGSGPHLRNARMQRHIIALKHHIPHSRKTPKINKQGNSIVNVQARLRVDTRGASSMNIR